MPAPRDTHKSMVRIQSVAPRDTHKLRLAFTNGIIMALEKRSLIDPEVILESAEREMEKLVKSKMKIYGCAAKARTTQSSCA